MGSPDKIATQLQEGHETRWPVCLVAQVDDWRALSSLSSVLFSQTTLCASMSCLTDFADSSIAAAIIAFATSDSVSPRKRSRLSFIDSSKTVQAW